MHRFTCQILRFGCLIALALLPKMSSAIVVLPNGAGQLTPAASFTAGYDSNITAAAGGKSDMLYTSGFSVGFLRKALYSIDANASVSLGRFAQGTVEGFADPSFNMKVVASGSPTRATLSLDASHSHEASGLVGEWVESRNYGAALSWVVPLVKRYSLGCSLGYAESNFGNPGLVAHTSLNGGVNVIYDFYPDHPQKLGLIAGYRYNTDDADRTGRSDDHNVNLGFRGKIAAKISGTLNLGIQSRRNKDTGLDFHAATFSSDLNWMLSDRFRLALTGAKRVDTPSVGGSIDSTNLSLNLDYRLRDNLGVHGSAGLGRSRFLDTFAAGRRDRYTNFSTGLQYHRGVHWGFSLQAAWYENASNELQSADFQRHTISFSTTFRW